MARTDLGKTFFVSELNMPRTRTWPVSSGTGSPTNTGSVTVTLQPVDANTSWSGSGVVANQVTFTGGTQVVTLNRNTAGTFSIGLTSTPTPQNPTRC